MILWNAGRKSVVQHTWLIKMFLSAVIVNDRADSCVLHLPKP